MKRFLTIGPLVVVTLFALAVGATTAAAIDVTGAAILDFPQSARVWAMGRNGVADNTEPANIFFNPANVVASNRLYFQGTRWGIAKDEVDDAWIGGLSAGFSHTTSRGLIFGVDLTYARLEFGEVMVVEPIDTTGFGPSPFPFVPTNETFTVTMGAGSSFGKDNEWRVGFAERKFWQAYHASLDTISVIDRPETYAFDFGASVMFRTSWNEWKLSPAFGLALVDLGSEILSSFNNTSYPLPTRFHFGGSLEMSSPRIVRVTRAHVPLLSVVANIDYTHRLHDQPVTWGTGGEVSLAKVLFVRGGFTDDPGHSADLDSSALGVGLGLPMESGQLRFDYTHTSISSQPDIYGVALLIYH